MGRGGGGGAGRRGSHDHVHEGALAATVLELHHPSLLGEQGVVLATPAVLAGEEARAALAHQDRAAAHLLAAEALDSQILRVGIAAVAARTLGFFVWHEELLLVFFPMSCGLR